MFDKFNPFNIESKGNIMIEIKGEMDAQGAKIDDCVHGELLFNLRN